jgi:hypothetical protein
MQLSPRLLVRRVRELVAGYQGSWTPSAPCRRFPWCFENTEADCTFALVLGGIGRSLGQSGQPALWPPFASRWRHGGRSGRKEACEYRPGSPTSTYGIPVADDVGGQPAWMILDHLKWNERGNGVPTPGDQEYSPALHLHPDGLPEMAARSSLMVMSRGEGSTISWSSWGQAPHTAPPARNGEPGETRSYRAVPIRPAPRRATG